MDNSMSCRLPGCTYSTTSQMPAEVEHYLHLQLFDSHIRASHVPKDKIVKSELAIKPDDVSTSVASSEDELILATQLERCECDEVPAVGDNAICQHCLGEAHGPDDKKTRKLLCPAWGFQCTRCRMKGHYPQTCYECAYCASWGYNSKKCDVCRQDRVQVGKIYEQVYQRVAQFSRCTRMKFVILRVGCSPIDGLVFHHA